MNNLTRWNYPNYNDSSSITVEQQVELYDKERNRLLKLSKEELIKLIIGERPYHESIKVTIGEPKEAEGVLGEMIKDLRKEMEKLQA